jgi:membrane protein implicated in regulation of membrane protease activity
MAPVFVICASVGGTILVLQFVLALIGLGGDALGVETPHDIGHDVGGMDHDFSAGDADHGDLGHDGGADGHAESPHSGPAHPQHGATSLFRALSLRTVTAALAFFGLAGLAAQAADCPPQTTLLIAVAAGLGAMYAVYAMLRGMVSLRAEGTVRIHHALGKQASVYLRIPGHRQGTGKIQINLQNRTMEYLAVTPGEAIPTGTAVVVTEVLGSDTVQVEAATP